MSAVETDTVTGCRVELLVDRMMACSQFSLLLLQHVGTDRPTSHEAVFLQDCVLRLLVCVLTHYSLLDGHIACLAATALIPWLKARDRLSGKVNITLTDVMDIVTLARRTGDPYDGPSCITRDHIRACELLKLLYSRLPSTADRQRAFMAIAQFALLSIDVALSTASATHAARLADQKTSSSGTGSSTVPAPSSAAYVPYPHEPQCLGHDTHCAHVLRLLFSCFDGVTPDSPMAGAS